MTLPLAPERSRPVWSSRALWSHVTANEHDPLHQGRIQVEFEWEHLDPQASHERAWLHTLTPSGGGSGGAKSTSYTGFYSVPEEKVELVALLRRPNLAVGGLLRNHTLF